MYIYTYTYIHTHTYTHIYIYVYVHTHIILIQPEGSVMVYSPNVLHRGRGNKHHLERTIMTMTLMGQHGLIPNGIPLASLPEDEASWYLARGLLTQSK